MSSSSNSRLPPPPPSTSSIRSALSITPGWGIGMSNSGSYLSTSTRTTLTIAVSSEEPAATYDGIKSILRKKKIREASALSRAAKKLKQEQKNAQANNDDDMRKPSEKKARDTATSKAMELRNQLNKLILQQSELEKSVQYEWKEKINNFEQRSLQEEEDEMNKLRQEHEQLKEKVRVEHENVEEKKFGATTLSETRKGKRKAARQEAEESRKKKPKVGGEYTTGKAKRGGGEQAGHDDDGTFETATVDNAKGRSEDMELVRDDSRGNGDVEKEVSLQSAKKDRELEKIVDEMNYLNKTKSQMIWLLKQVITAEKKLK